MTVRLKRVYESLDPGDGYRVLVERLWPRGMSKERATVDLWLKEAGASTDLRTWYGHDPEKWEEFRRTSVETTRPVRSHTVSVTFARRAISKVTVAVGLKGLGNGGRSREREGTGAGSGTETASGSNGNILPSAPTMIPRRSVTN